ncbi:glutathione S-transferase family protein [Celeribacter neptunius]|uniref:Glutathione S-transferase n=1 Tax=Celeribacter neptunius TaxID=588602 RepID=A0A1I3JU72_9RHOB|nr:glutathione S-transferase family protein [Celeribacter neptunius]SFI63640.1 glutathione S-transferase [Celeribacter neptunius]
MLTLYHAPNTRSSRIITQLIALGKLDQVDIRLTDIPRQDGRGGHDPQNPHPEGKVPLLVTESGEEIRESTAIMLYLSEIFPSALAPAAGESGRGAFLSWMSWYGNVMEPVYLHHVAGVSHPVLTATFRQWPEAVAYLAAGLTGRDYLLGDRYSLADLLISSPFLILPDAVPEVPEIQAWVARCAARPEVAATLAYDARASAELGLTAA